MTIGNYHSTTTIKAWPTEKTIKPLNIYSRYLINYMWWKTECIDATLKRKSKYFIQKDAKDISNWPEKEAKAIWIRQQTLIEHAATIGDTDICPFCLKEMIKQESKKLSITFCYDCTYKKKHKQCGEENSTYLQITNSLSCIDLMALFEKEEYSIQRYLRRAQYELDKELKQ